MHNGDIYRFIVRRRVVAGVVALVVGGSLAGCKTAAAEDAGAKAPAAAASSAPPASYFGASSFGKLSVTMTEAEALATGELQPEPVQTVLGRNVYSFVGGPKPDPAQMAQDKKIEAAAEKAEKSTDTSAAGSAKAAQAYADSAERSLKRLEAYLGAGGASFWDGKLVSIAAPKEAATEAGIKRGATEAELKAAYEGKGLKKSSKSTYELPVAGQPGWTVLFELEKNAVKYMSIGKAG